jgi:lipopolysaccharide export LptBFGC system permease protein LptF
VSSISSIFLVYIAYQQMKTNRDKLNLDLYEKRFEVYQRTLTFYQMLMDKTLDTPTHRSFIESKEAAFFLFPDNREIFDLLDRVNLNSFEVTELKNKIEESKGSPDYLIQSFHERDSAMSEISEDIKRLKVFLSPYLNAPHLQKFGVVKSKLREWGL